MPLLTKISTRLRRRRAAADRVWREATRQQDAERIRRGALQTQDQARAEAFARILDVARATRR